MCWNCGPLIKAIDAYIQKADSELEETLEAEGYQKPGRTLEYLEELEEKIAEALLLETDYFLSAIEKAVDLEAFAAQIWPGVVLNDELREKLAEIFLEYFGNFMPEFTGYYIEQTDKELKLAQVSKRTTAWVKTWSGQLADIMQLHLMPGLS